jgi:vacuolar protein sorting-associated protein 13D
MTYDKNKEEQKMLLNILSIQICNQLLNSLRKNLLYIQIPNDLSQNLDNTQNYDSPTSTRIGTSAAVAKYRNQLSLTSAQDSVNKPASALQIDFARQYKYENITTIKHLIITMFDVNLQIEERLLWKLIQFIGGIERFKNKNDLYLDSLIQNDSDDQLNDNFNRASTIEQINNLRNSISNNYYKKQVNSHIASSQAAKFSFNKLKINTIKMILSVYKTSKLSSDLLKVKGALNIPLIQFENARIECKPFILMNEHDAAYCILMLIKKHYEQELRSNAIRILGSVDFLGNPLGLVVDVKESINNILLDGQLSNFVFSITHGVANSVSKLSGSLSEELTHIAIDERHRETREQIRTIYSNGSVDHFVGGALGFAVGVVGGIMSLATQTYQGMCENGMSGAFVGLGKGAVGTVSKPVVGILDLATGIASAIKETSKTTVKMEMNRVRESRCCGTSGTILAPFSRSDADGQKILYQVNNYTLTEKFITLEQLNNRTEPLIVT